MKISSVSEIDHRLNGEYHARYEQHSGISSCDIADERILVELQTDAMTADVTDNFIALALGKFIDHRADIAKPVKRTYF